MCQPVQRIVDALRSKWCQRLRFFRCKIKQPVDDAVVGAVEIRNIENVSQRAVQPFRSSGFDIGAFQKGEMQRDRRGRFADEDRDAMIADKQFYLVFQIELEKVRAGDCRGVAARGRDMP